MYRYTPKKEVLEEMNTNLPKQSYPNEWIGNRIYRKKEILLQIYGLPTNFTFTTLLGHYYKDVDFYSILKLNEIPVNGYLFPSSMFNEQEINE